MAGGSGQRFGAAKQFAALGRGRVVDAACDAARRGSDGIVVVLPPDALGAWTVAAAEEAVAGGATRSDSVRAGLDAVPADADVICVHDAARPLATPALFARVVAAVRAGADGAVPAGPVADTIKLIDAGGLVQSTVDRAAVVAVQTPQAFRADVLRRAHAGGAEATDDASLVERIGGRVVTVEGEARNRKITTPDDLDWARSQLGEAPRSPAIDVRVGNGFDVHRVGDDATRPMVLGGCVFPGLPGLAGHSDGDAIAHAIADALLGAAGLGDLGQRFADTDPAWAGADSMGLLGHVVEWVRAGGWSIGNADCSVVCEAPALAPRRDEMQQRLADALGAPVAVKGRRPEGLGALGRGEGVVCLVSVILTRTNTTGHS